jgi:hypothetical protein
MAYTTINKSSEYFNTKLYTGNGSTQSISSVGFQPDWVWLKGRSGSGRDNLLFDAIRGATNYIKSNATSAEATISSTLTSFDSDGFSIGSNSGVNTNSETFVSWNWLANGAGVSNTDGDITSTVSASTTSGFSIVKYTGTASNATVGHGLGVKPAMMIAKNLDNGSEDWCVYHKSLGYNNVLKLNSSNAILTATNRWNAEPDTNVFNVGTAAEANGSGANQIAYVFAEKKGFSKFGSYTGNGNADGTFVYTGFKPAYVLTKRTDGSYIWSITDGVRNPYNPTSLSLQTEYADAESGWSPLEVDFLSNGFKLRTSSAQKNGSGSPFIYMAFAEEPLVGTNNIPATAR